MTGDPLAFARVVIGGCYLGLGLVGYLISLPQAVAVGGTGAEARGR